MTMFSFPRIPYHLLKDDVLKGENKQQFRNSVGGHLFYDEMEFIKNVRHMADTLKMDYIKKRQGNYCPIKCGQYVVYWVYYHLGVNPYLTGIPEMDDDSFPDLM